MKSIKKDNKELFQISDIDIKLLEHDLLNVDDDIDRRLQWVISHKCEQIYKRFKDEWESKLVSEGAESIPAQRDAFVNMITARQDYKNRATREAESQEV